MTEVRRRGVPVFLSIGYSTCHWCHVMAKETFSDPVVGDRLNQDFIAIKVDREERPDLDRIYMSYVQAVTGRGGWPLSVWLTPDLKPFFGGTYFPPEDRGEQPGFNRVLESISSGWKQERDRVVAESDRILANLSAAKQTESMGEALPDLTAPGGDAFEQAYTYFFENHDAQSGGFGGAPKFPRPQVIEFLLRCAALQGLESESGREAVAMVQQSLLGMARGGIHDHVGGGFHRYAVDEDWRLPHFEKMLYDQAQIAGNLLEAYHFTADERFAGMAKYVFTYLAREMRHPAGGFFSAEDADSLPQADAAAKHEGAFYGWTWDELVAVVGDEIDWIGPLYGLSPLGNIPPRLDPTGGMKRINVLHQAKPLQEVALGIGKPIEALAASLDQILQTLRIERAKRPRPHRDEKVVTSWNGLLISSLARASVSDADSLQDSARDYLEMAQAAAGFVRDQLWDHENKVLFRAWRAGERSGPGFAEDYASMVAGLLELYEATFDPKWLVWADTLQSVMDRQFWDEEGGGYFQTSQSDPLIVLRLKDDYDGAEPSTNSLAVANLFRLSALLHDEDRHTRAMKTLQAFRHVWAETPWALPAMLTGVEWALAGLKQVLITGDPTDLEFQCMVVVARDRRGSRRVTVACDPAKVGNWLRNRLPAINQGSNRAQAQICTNSECSPLYYSAADLREALNA